MSTRRKQILVEITGVAATSGYTVRLNAPFQPDEIVLRAIANDIVAGGAAVTPQLYSIWCEELGGFMGIFQGAAQVNSPQTRLQPTVDLMTSPVTFTLKQNNGPATSMTANLMIQMEFIKYGKTRS